MIPILVRVTRTTKCKEGFYALVNGQRIRFNRRADAYRAIVDLLTMQRFQVVTVREYARRIKIPKNFSAANNSQSKGTPP